MKPCPGEVYVNEQHERCEVICVAQNPATGASAVIFLHQPTGAIHWVPLWWWSGCVDLSPGRRVPRYRRGNEQQRRAA